MAKPILRPSKGRRPRARRRATRLGARRAQSEPAGHGDGLGNPLEIHLPESFLSPKKAEQILSLKRSQERMWSWALTLSIITFFVISFISISSYAGWTDRPPARMQQILEQADLMAITVFALEFAAQYRKAENKALFFKKNWLGIVAILPMGLFLRAAEGIGVIRAAQAALKLERLELLLPSVNMAQKTSVHVPTSLISDAMLSTHDTLSHFSVVSDFAELLAKAIRGILR